MKQKLHFICFHIYCLYVFYQVDDYCLVVLKSLLTITGHTSQCNCVYCLPNYLPLIKQYRNAFRTYITKTYLYDFDPLKPHFYIVKLGFTGVYYFFLFLLKNIDCVFSLEPPRRGGSNEVHTIYVLSRNMKNVRIFLSEYFQFLVVKFSIYLNRRVFVMQVIAFFFKPS